MKKRAKEKERERERETHNERNWINNGVFFNADSKIDSIESSDVFRKTLSLDLFNAFELKAICK